MTDSSGDRQSDCEGVSAALTLRLREPSKGNGPAASRACRQLSDVSCPDAAPGGLRGVSAARPANDGWTTASRGRLPERMPRPSPGRPNAVWQDEGVLWPCSRASAVSVRKASGSSTWHETFPVRSLTSTLDGASWGGIGEYETNAPEAISMSQPTTSAPPTPGSRAGGWRVRQRYSGACRRASAPCRCLIATARRAQATSYLCQPPGAIRHMHWMVKPANALQRWQVGICPTQLTHSSSLIVVTKISTAVQNISVSATRNGSGRNGTHRRAEGLPAARPGAGCDQR